MIDIQRWHSHNRVTLKGGKQTYAESGDTNKTIESSNKSLQLRITVLFATMLLSRRRRRSRRSRSVSDASGLWDERCRERTAGAVLELGSQIAIGNDDRALRAPLKAVTLKDDTR